MSHIILLSCNYTSVRESHYYMHPWESEYHEGLRGKVDLNPPPNLKILLKLVTRVARELKFQKFGHMHIWPGYACFLTSFLSISGYFQYLILGALVHFTSQPFIIM